MKTILAPVDFSSATASVIAAAQTLAAAMFGRIVLLHVVQPPILTSDYGLAVDHLHEAIAVSEKHASKRMEELTSQLRSRMIEPVEMELANGAPIAAIVDGARRLGADYIVMGSHGHTAIYDLLVGTTTHGVLRKAPCPVVIVPPGKSVSDAVH